LLTRIERRELPTRSFAPPPSPVLAYGGTLKPIGDSTRLEGYSCDRTWSRIGSQTIFP